MIPNLVDHLFVLLVLVIAFPIGGWWAYRRFLERLARDGARALVREYRITIIWLICLGAGTIAIWLTGGREWLTVGRKSRSMNRITSSILSSADAVPSKIRCMAPALD